MREKNGIILGAWVGCYHLYLREGGGAMNFIMNLVLQTRFSKKYLYRTVAYIRRILKNILIF